MSELETVCKTPPDRTNGLFILKVLQQHGANRVLNIPNIVYGDKSPDTSADARI